MRAKTWRKIMTEKIIIFAFLMIVIGASAIAWWFENGPERRDTDKKEGTEE